MDLTSPEMKEIGDAIVVLHRDGTEQGRPLLLQLWEKHSANGAPIQISTLAHYLADTETDVGGELEWDLKSLEAATGSRACDDRDPVSADLASFLPSLHLNVADCYRRLGDVERARLHAGFAENRIGVLADDPYGKLIRGGLRRLLSRLPA
jgi:hypothetical protein